MIIDKYIKTGKEDLRQYDRKKTTAEEMSKMKFEKPEYWIKDICPKGATIVIGSKAGKGKTLYTLAQLTSMIKGQSFLERFPVLNEPKKILYIDLDDNGFQSLHWKIEYLLNGSKFNKNIRKKIEFQQEFDIDDLQTELKNIEPYDIIVLDSYRRFLKGDENDSSVTNRFFKQFIKPAKEMGKTIIILHHFKKGDMSQISDQDLVDSFRGSSDLPTQVQVAYGLIQSEENEDFENRTLKFNITLHRAKDRDAIVTKSFNFNILKDEKINSTTFTWNGFGGLKKEKSNNIEEKAILEFVQEHPNSAREEILQNVVTKVDSSIATIDRRLKEITLLGKVQKTKHGIYTIVKENTISSNASDLSIQRFLTNYFITNKIKTFTYSELEDMMIKKKCSKGTFRMAIMVLEANSFIIKDSNEPTKYHVSNDLFKNNTKADDYFQLNW